MKKVVIAVASIIVAVLTVFLASKPQNDSPNDSYKSGYGKYLMANQAEPHEVDEGSTADDPEYIYEVPAVLPEDVPLVDDTSENLVPQDESIGVEVELELEPLTDEELEALLQYHLENPPPAVEMPIADWDDD